MPMILEDHLTRIKDSYILLEEENGSELQQQEELIIQAFSKWVYLLSQLNMINKLKLKSKLKILLKTQVEKVAMKAKNKNDENQLS